MSRPGRPQPRPAATARAGTRRRGRGGRAPGRPAGAARAIGAVAALVTLAGSGVVLPVGAQPTAATPAAAANPSGTLRLTPLVGSGMVVQRGRRIPVWGWAAPGRPVTVTLDRGRPVRTVADRAGAWRVDLPALPAGGPHALVVASGAERVTVDDVLVGDVWVAGGQSNMEMTVAAARDAEREIAAARDPGVRHFKVPTAWARTPAPTLPGGRWTVADAAHVGEFSAVAWYFARALRAPGAPAERVPIGILNVTWGGSRIEPWMSRAALGAVGPHGAHGAGAAEVDRRIAAEEAAQQAAATVLRARLGGSLPAVDGGMVDGRPVWADPALADTALADTAGWSPITVPGTWEGQGWGDMDGTAWYRTTVDLTAAEAAAGIRLGLGRIDDGDATYVNGVPVGATPDAYNRPRVYAVAPAVLRVGPNVVAVRVTDHGGGGGIAGAADELFVEALGARRALTGPWRFRPGAVTHRPDGQRVNKVPTVLHHAMVHPLAPFPVAGVLWYQGESNAETMADARAYASLLPALVADWRRLWRRPDLPFLVVQLPGYGAPAAEPPAEQAWATLREAQLAAARTVPGVATVVTLDLGEADDIHPANKQDVGVRLALAARRLAYGDASPATASGPTYRRHTVAPDGTVTLEFNSSSSDMVTEGSEPGVHGLAVAGPDRRFVWATGRVEGNRVLVRSPAVPHPVAVRYAWEAHPARANLRDRRGLPAAPFRTDRW